VAVLAAEYAHVTVSVACRMLGLGADRIRLVAADEQRRMLASELEAALRDWDDPTIVCAQAGEINTGAFDPIAEILEPCKGRGAWCHVDAAFGLWAAISPTRRRLLDGFEGADSWATDAHKWLNVPYDCGIAAVADASAHRASMTSSAAYIPAHDDDVPWPFDWTPEKTALRFEGRKVSYAELEQDVASAAAWLRADGVSPGDRVGYLGPNCPELLELLFACRRRVKRHVRPSFDEAAVLRDRCEQRAPRCDLRMAVAEADLDVDHSSAGGSRRCGRPDEPLGQARVAEALDDLGLHIHDQQRGPRAIHHLILVSAVARLADGMVENPIDMYAVLGMQR
jgi:Pyridoxal-dependent decarboxylase conserved domain/AMP-binding enzyme